MVQSILRVLLWVPLAISTYAAAADQPSARPLVKDFLGINGHTVLFKPALYSPVCTLVRDYHPVDWDLAKETATLPEFPFAKNRVDWSQVYGSWQQAGYRTNVCLMFDSIPADRWHDLDADASAYGRLFASQFGPGGKTPRVESVEIGNEPGKYSDEQYPRIFRAMAKGLRAGDAKLRIATCNLTTGKSHAYAKSVTTLQGLTDLLDILTIHTYPELEPYPTWRRSFPEDPRLNYLQDVRALAQWRDQHAPGKPIWITEFGYDASTKQPDPKTEFAKWVGVSDEQQAQYLVRSVLLFCNLPVERAYIYFFNDDDTPHVHGSAGLTRNFVPKPAYYALAHFQKTLGEYRFSKVLLEKANEAYAYEFTHARDASRRIVAVWSPTGSGKTATISLDLPGWKIAHAEAMPLTKDTPARLEITDTNTIPLSETPIYLHLRAINRP
ncbi:MAG TPA: hypothetical protein VHP11_09385 [Tepidisphaeraceae bacterium]|nr:hypothetical protein [Tepidisphaeraceae bacterium]